jgi:hypothetical protein
VSAIAPYKLKTGKTWEEWYALMDAAGCKDMHHKGIVAYLADNFKIDPWWQQQVTVAYEGRVVCVKNTRPAVDSRPAAARR